MKVQFTVPGKPMGKQRPRVMRSGITFTPKETVNYETLVKLAYAQATREMFEGPLHMEIRAYYEIPKSTSKKKAELMRTNVERPTKKPDIDNIVKIICDALNKVAYHDDSQIVGCEARKFYSDNPRVEIEIGRWNN